MGNNSGLLHREGCHISTACDMREFGRSVLFVNLGKLVGGEYEKLKTSNVELCAYIWIREEYPTHPRCPGRPLAGQVARVRVEHESSTIRVTPASWARGNTRVNTTTRLLRRCGGAVHLGPSRPTKVPCIQTCSRRVRKVTSTAWSGRNTDLG